MAGPGHQGPEANLGPRPSTTGNRPRQFLRIVVRPPAAPAASMRTAGATRRGWLQKLPRGIDAVVSLCPVVDADVPVGLRDLEVRFIDQFGANQNLDFVLFDTVRAIEALRDESATVFSAVPPQTAELRPLPRSTVPVGPASTSIRRWPGMRVLAPIPTRLPGGAASPASLRRKEEPVSFSQGPRPSTQWSAGPAAPGAVLGRHLHPPAR